MKTLTKAFTDNGVERGMPFRTVLLTFLLTMICGLLLAGCAMPEAISTQGSQSDQGVKVEAIQTRVAQERAGQASDKQDAMAGASDGAQGQTASAEESGGQLVSGPTAEQLELLAKLRPQGEAPELLNQVWLNSEPLKLADLRGNVVLVEFWTYG